MNRTLRRLSFLQRYLTPHSPGNDESCSNPAVQKSVLNGLLVVVSVVLTAGAAETVVRWQDADDNLGPAARHLDEIPIAAGVDRAWFYETPPTLPNVRPVPRRFAGAGARRRGQLHRRGHAPGGYVQGMERRVRGRSLPPPLSLRRAGPSLRLRSPGRCRGPGETATLPFPAQHHDDGPPHDQRLRLPSAPRCVP